jgi:hypothetical protein
MVRTINCGMFGKFAALLVFVALLTVTATTQASVVVLTGGDAGDNWVAPSSPLFAYNLTGTNETIQGVTFVQWTGPTAPPNGAAVALTTNGGGTPYGPPAYASPTANDTAMANMISTIFYSTANSGAGPLNITMSGFTANTPYRIDLFTYSGDINRNNVYSFNGVATETWSQTALVSYLVQNTVTSNGSGVISLDITIPDPDESVEDGINGLNPILSGIVVSPVPEPNAIFLIGLGGAFIFTRLRRRSAR